MCGQVTDPQRPPRTTCSWVWWLLLITGGKTSLNLATTFEGVNTSWTLTAKLRSCQYGSVYGGQAWFVTGNRTVVLAGNSLGGYAAL